MPTAVTIANITVAAPPMTGPGTPATIWPIFGSSPSRISMEPQAVTTHRLRTRVSPTRPTFSAKAVSGKEFRNPASTADRASVARYRTRCWASWPRASPRPLAPAYREV
jgi:hypothetical protein